MTETNQESAFENHDFSALEKKVNIKLKDDVLYIHAPLFRNAGLGFISLLATIGLFYKGDFREALFFLIATLIVFSHHSYVEISTGKISTKLLFFGWVFGTKTLYLNEIDNLYVIQDSRSQLGNKQVSESFLIRADSKKKQADSSVKVKDSITIIQGIKNDEKLAIQFAEYLKNKMGIQ